MLLPALLIAGLAGPSSPARVARVQAEEPAQGQSPIWVADFEEAKAQALLQNRLILLVFVGARCPSCPALENGVLKDPRVVAWMERHVIALRVFDDAELSALYGVETLPAVMLLDRSLKEVDRVTERLEPPAMVTALVDVYEGRGGVARAQRDVDANPEDPDAHLQLARALRNRGRSSAALVHFLWAFDHMRGDPAREEERLGTVLGELKVLQRGSAEASRALQARRDAAASKLIDAYDPETPLAELLLCARELETLNSAISNVAFTEYAWETLRKREGYPREVVDALFVTTVQSKLIQDKRYQDYLDAIGDPLVRLDQELAGLQAQRARMVEERRPAIEIQNAGNGIAHRATWYYDALYGLGRTPEADALIEMLLTLEPSAQAYVLMVGSLHRSGRLEQAAALREQGLAKLPENSEKKRFERVTRQILAQAGR
jgi:tetratricopeptide (TPR) repeat protein